MEGTARSYDLVPKDATGSREVAVAMSPDKGDVEENGMTVLCYNRHVWGGGKQGEDTQDIGDKTTL